MTDNKLAEEILLDIYRKYNKTGVRYYTSEVIKAMEQYHQVKLKEITDADIEAWAKSVCEFDKDTSDIKTKFDVDFVINCIIRAKITGAKAALSNEIKHIDK